MISVSSIAVRISWHYKRTSRFARYEDVDIDISALWADVNIGEKIDELHIFYDGYSVFDIGQIKNLPNLRTLEIEGTAPVNFSCFEYCGKKLRKLVLHCFINEEVIHSISNVTSLRHLDLGNGSRSEIRDISPLGKLKNLRTLVISGTLRELSPIARLETLEDLTIFSDVLSDISVLGELKGLRKLEIYGAIDINLNALEELTNSMQHLAVKVEYIDSLTMLVNLRHLELRAENIKDIRPLRNLRRVRYLEVSKNFWTSLQIKRITKELDLRVRKYSDYYILDEEDEEDEEFYEFIRRLRHFH